MAIVEDLVNWTTATFQPLGLWGLFILAFIEASFFPIPVDVLLAILVLENPALTPLFALIAAVGSVLGGMFGYGIGYVGEETVVKKLVSKKKLQKVHNLFQKYEAWGVFIAGFTPIPYKLATIASGLFYLNFKKFVLACIAGRFLRFFLVAYLVMWFGEPIISFFDKHLMIATIVGILVVIAYVYYKRKN